jgi:hypothetical protein
MRSHACAHTGTLSTMDAKTCMHAQTHSHTFTYTTFIPKPKPPSSPSSQQKTRHMHVTAKSYLLRTFQHFLAFGLHRLPVHQCHRLLIELFQTFDIHSEDRLHDGDVRYFFHCVFEMVRAFVTRTRAYPSHARVSLLALFLDERLHRWCLAECLFKRPQAFFHFWLYGCLTM